MYSERTLPFERMEGPALRLIDGELYEERSGGPQNQRPWSPLVPQVVWAKLFPFLRWLLPPGMFENGVRVGFKIHNVHRRPV